ncbi:type II toxin-antitoxin system Phd/YefM family antitoxin [Argonema antarcticum]|uniref:type II toxin-antitoxin system Phd/YefM family antitoxin n=1 Tax=Argonema antarcticum TaxID=2942763 RepID=UPI002013948C|nr:type II toxin-antitoxin system Phd/YefM family antitoxin [Argonema antarcticum]MCL1473327.1 type II toxin-antitoxin system Phd/YefM family antitoxin [Argonema antarcticum A004/B2]
MSKITVEEASQNLQAILEQVAKGQEVSLWQEGRVVARVVPPLTNEEWLAKRDKSRASIKLKGEPISQTVIRLRQEERY